MAITLTFLGHAGFLLEDETHTVAIDPWLTGNPVATMKPQDICADHIVVTHGHSDHFADVLFIAAENDATVYSAFEIMEYLNEQGHEKCQPGNPGGRIETNFGWVAFTQAFHSSSFKGRYLGQPCGAVVHLGGITVYHCGDTALFGDMKLLGEIYKPDIALIPVGDRFTMGPELGRRAAEMIRPKVAVPIHYKTFPGMLVEDISAFQPAGVEVRILEPGETWSFG
ncbi:MAG: metal-dependent hydrolase [Phycisphaerae bacterium]